VSTISVTRNHDLSHTDAKRVANAVAAQFKKKYGVHSRWQNKDTLDMERAGTRGKVQIGLGVIRLELRLGLMLVAFGDPIRRDMERVLDDQLTAKLNQAKSR
jgi:putative polyhydroxyalkanoate system protein